MFSDFKQFTVATTFTPSMVIENVLGKTGDDAKGWAITEVVEIGDGEWKKVWIDFSFEIVREVC